MLLGATALIAVMFALNPQWDLALSRPYYDPTSKDRAALLRHWVEERFQVRM